MYDIIPLDAVPQLCEDPNKLVVVEASPEFGGINLLFQTLDDQHFLARWREWVSRYMCLSELFQLREFVAELERTGHQVLFTETTGPILDAYQRWEAPIEVDGFACPGGENAGLYPFQQFTLNRALERAANARPEDRLFFAGWCAGAGKAEPLSEPVLTPQGWRTMGDLRPGDYVIGSDGHPTRIISVHPQGAQPVFRIEMNDGTFVRCNSEHLWNVRKFSTRRRGPSASSPSRKERIEEAPWKTLTTAEIAASLEESGGIGRRWQLPVLAPVRFTADINLPMDPYALGVFLGDGCWAKDQASVSTDRWIIEHLGWNPRAHAEAKGHPCHTLAGVPRFRRDVLIALGLKGLGSHERFVPAQYLTAAIDDRLALLQGLLDTGGSSDPRKSTVEYSTTSPMLRDAVADLVRGLGGKATVSAGRITAYTGSTGERIPGRQSWRIRISISSPPFRLPRKLDRWHPPTKYEPIKTITDVVNEGVSEEQVCIVVDAPDSLYVTRGHTLTHNTLFACAGAQELFNRGQIDLVLCFTLMSMKHNFAHAAKASFAKTTRLDAVVVEGSKGQRNKAYAAGHDVYVLNYEKAWADHEKLKALTAGKRVLWVMDEALALDTPVLTRQEGWKTIGQLRVDEEIPGSKGWVSVLRKTPVKNDAPCYRVTTQDGGGVTCSGDHLWTVCGGQDGSALMDVTTEEMAFMVRLFQHGWSRRPVRLALPLGVEYSDADLPLDPYLLGYWLGDGVTGQAHVCVGDQDLAFLENELWRRGFVVTNRRAKNDRGAQELHLSVVGADDTRNGLSVRGGLIAAGVLGHKHIPRHYLESSRWQRLELLRGLMDADGHCAARGESATFTQKPGALVDSVEQLIRSLGYSPQRRILRASGFVTDSQAHQLVWHPIATENPFKNPRKAVRVRGRQRVASKKVVSVEPVDSVPVQCLKVDAPDHLFAVGSSWMLTHNCQKVVTAETSEKRKTKTRKHLDALVRGCEATVWPMSASVVGANPLRYRDVFNLAGTERGNPLGTAAEFEKHYSTEVRKFFPSRWAEPITYYTWSVAKLHEVRHRVSDRTQSARKTDPGVREFFKGNKLEQVPIQMAPEVRKLYDAVVGEAMAFQQASPDESLMGHYLLLRYVCNTPLALAATTSEAGRAIADKYPKLITNAHNAKLGFFLDQVESIADAGDKVLAFTRWTNLGLHLLSPEVERRGIRHVLHWGVGQSPAEKQAAIDRFKEDDSVTLFLSSDAGAAGLSLPEAKYNISYECPYSYDMLMQRSERNNRADSEHDTTTYVYITEDSVEERIWDICEERRKLAAATLGTAETLNYGGRSGKSEEANVKFLIFGKD